jgi:putative endonuclease
VFKDEQMTQKAGLMGEQKALDYLTKQGLNLVARNYRCRLGEIDLIMNDPMYLVFIEVRSRVNTAFGGGLASITYAKRQKIIKTTSHYLLTHKIREQQPIRFDVVSIDGHSGQLEWIKDAFNTDY